MKTACRFLTFALLTLLQLCGVGVVVWYLSAVGGGGSGECAFPCFKPVKHLHLCCKCCLKIFTRTIPHPLFKVDDLHNGKIHSHEKEIFKNLQCFICLITLLKKNEKLPIIIPPWFPCSIMQTPPLCCTDAAASSRVAPSDICPPSHLLPSLSHHLCAPKTHRLVRLRLQPACPPGVYRHLQPLLASSSHRLLPPHFLPHPVRGQVATLLVSGVVFTLSASAALRCHPISLAFSLAIDRLALAPQGRKSKPIFPTTSPPWPPSSSPLFFLSLHFSLVHLVPPLALL